MGPYFKTEAGLNERSLPLLTMVVPTSILEKFPAMAKNLETNQQRLITMWDLHKTLNHISTYPAPPPPAPNPQLDPSWSLSIFEEIKSRSCKQAHVPQDVCGCGNYK